MMLNKWDWMGVKAEIRKGLKKSAVDWNMEVSPVHAMSQSRQTLIFTLNIGEPGINVGGRVFIYIPIFSGGMQNKHNTNTFQIFNPDLPFNWYNAFVSAHTSRKDTEIELEVSNFGAAAGVVEVGIGRNPLKEGDKLTIVLGDSRGGEKFYIQEASQKLPFSVGIDIDGSGEYHRLKNFPVLSVESGPASEFKVTAKAIQMAGKEFSLNVSAIDKCGNQAKKYTGRIRFESSDKKASLPKEYEFTNKDEGQHKFSGLELHSKGIHWMSAIDTKSGLIGKSNPISIDFLGEDKKIYFGEIHGHTYLSDGKGTEDECLTLAKDVDSLDFAALGDHSIEGGFNVLPEDNWKRTKSAIQKYNKPNEFVTLLGYEWNSWSGAKGNPNQGWGDKNIYYLNDDEPCYGAGDSKSDDPEKLCNLLKDKEAIVIPHHSMYGGRTDWSFKNNDLQRVVEIYSIAGNSEKGSEYSVQSALAQGHKLGFIAGSDNHCGQLAHNESANRRAGLAVVITDDLTREKVFYALKNRHCYATTGKRILLYFTLNGYLMGEEISLKGDDFSRKIRVRVAGTTKIKEIVIVRNNVDIHIHSGKGSFENFEYIDKDDFTEELFYYVRVIQEDEEIAWSSPIWVKNK